MATNVNANSAVDEIPGSMPIAIATGSAAYLQNGTGNGHAYVKTNADNLVSLSESTSTHVTKINIAIIGAGMGGMAFAIAAQRKFGTQEDFLLFERLSEVGGTWRDHKYPGCSSDVPMPWYCFSTNQRTDWIRPYALHNEIQDYIVSVAEEEFLHRRCMFNTSVVSADWNPSLNKYVIVTENLIANEKGAHERRVYHAKVLVSAVGQRFDVGWPDIPGLVIPEIPGSKGLRVPLASKPVEGSKEGEVKEKEWRRHQVGNGNENGDEDGRFEGVVMHTAKWDTDVDLRGKRVVVIGNGASAVQLIPIISQDPSTRVVNFARTPMWMVPPLSNAHYSETLRFIQKYSRLATWIHRAMVFLMFETRFVMWRAGGVLNKLGEKFLRWYMRYKVPAKYHDVMIPTYAPGCKRLIINSGYLDSLHRENVELSFERVVRVKKGSVIVRGVGAEVEREVPCDVIVCATGYDTDTFPVPIRGAHPSTSGSGSESKKMTLKEYWDSLGGPTAYLGTVVPGFPNLFVIGGPNAASGHASMTFMEETQANFSLRIIEPILRNQVSAVEPTISATEAYNKEIQQKLGKSVMAQCTSWYRAGADGSGKITAMWPGMVSGFWWRTLGVDWSDYNVFMGEGDGKKLLLARGRSARVLRAIKLMMGGLLAAGIVYGYRKGYRTESVAWLAEYARVELNKLVQYIAGVVH